MSNELPISVKIQLWWHAQAPWFQMSVSFIGAALVAFMQIIADGGSLHNAAIAFIVTLLTLIKTFQAISKTADKHIQEAKDQQTKKEIEDALKNYKPSSNLTRE